ncbi:MAG TPA: hypothetical protein VIL99_12545 [Ignavibacteria bacterium]
MDTEKKIQDEIDQTIQSIEGIKRAGVNPYVFNKIMSRLNEKEEPSIFAFKGFKLAFAMVTLFIIVNLVTIFLIQKDSTQSVYTREQMIDNITYEYFLKTPYYNY